MDHATNLAFFFSMIWINDTGAHISNWSLLFKWSFSLANCITVRIKTIQTSSSLTTKYKKIIMQINKLREACAINIEQKVQLTFNKQNQPPNNNKKAIAKNVRASYSYPLMKLQLRCKTRAHMYSVHIKHSQELHNFMYSIWKWWWWWCIC